MNTLFIDTHGDFIFLAIYKNDKILIEKEIYEKKDHSTVCFPTLVGLLSDANLDIHDIHDLPNRLFNNKQPSFRFIPSFVVGIPVLRATLAFNLLIPNARFHEKLSPGIFIFCPIAVIPINSTCLFENKDPPSHPTSIDPFAKSEKHKS